MRRQPERLHLLLSLQPRDPAHYRVGLISINIITAIIMHGRQDKHNHHHHPGLHKLWYPVVRDMSTWSKFGAHGEHGDVFLFSNLGALWFSENFIRYSLHICLRGGQEQSFFLQKLLFTAFLVTILKTLTYALVSTWSSVISGYEHVPQLMQPCMNCCQAHYLMFYSWQSLKEQLECFTKSFKCTQ